MSDLLTFSGKQLVIARRRVGLSVNWICEWCVWKPRSSEAQIYDPKWVRKIVWIGAMCRARSNSIRYNIACNSWLGFRESGMLLECCFHTNIVWNGKRMNIKKLYILCSICYVEDRMHRIDLKISISVVFCWISFLHWWQQIVFSYHWTTYVCQELVIFWQNSCPTE